MAFEITSWEIGAITVNEPVTALTDVLISVVAFYAFLKRNGHVKYEWTHVFFRYYFLFLGLGTLYGGIVGHAFIHYLGFEWKLPGWIISMISVALVERASIMHAKPFMPPGVGRFFSIFNWVELFTLLFCVIYFMNFFLVETVERELRYNDEDIEEYKPGFWSNVGDAFSKGWEFVKLFFIGLITIWPLLLLGVGIYFLVKWISRKSAAK